MFPGFTNFFPSSSEVFAAISSVWERGIFSARNCWARMGRRVSDRFFCAIFNRFSICGSLALGSSVLEFSSWKKEVMGVTVGRLSRSSANLLADFDDQLEIQDEFKLRCRSSAWRRDGLDGQRIFKEFSTCFQQILEQFRFNGFDFDFSFGDDRCTASWIFIEFSATYEVNPETFSSEISPKISPSDSVRSTFTENSLATWELREWWSRWLQVRHTRTGSEIEILGTIKCSQQHCTQKISPQFRQWCWRVEPQLENSRNYPPSE